MSNYLSINIKVICKACGMTSVYDSDTDILNEVCGYCGHNFGKKIKIYVDDIIDACSGTHTRNKWFCNMCESSGIKWIEKPHIMYNCPSCGYPLNDINITKLNPNGGSCKTIWD